MKNKIITCIFLALSLLAKSQEKLNNIKAPSSPASSILGLQSTTVLAPKSYRALETAIFSNFLNGADLTIPNDFAIEFTPYWTKNHSLSLDEYLYPKNGFDQIVRNSSFSMASTQNFILGDSTTSNGMAFGYRTTFYIGNNNDREQLKSYEDSTYQSKKIRLKIYKKAERIGESIEDSTSNITNNDEFFETIRNAIYNSLRLYKNKEDTDEITNQIILDSDSLSQLDIADPYIFIDAFMKIVDAHLKSESIFNNYKTYIKKRQGLAIDLAYANFLNFPSNNFEKSVIPRQSMWITPVFRFKKNLSFLKLIAVFKYEWYNVEYYKKYFPALEVYKNNTNYGIAIATEFEKFSFQFEFVGQKSKTDTPAGTDTNGNQLFTKDEKSDIQYIGTFNYNISKQIVLSYNFGNRFDPILNSENTLVSSLSLNFGFGSPTTKTIK